MTVESSEPVGSLAVALAHAARLLEARPALAVEQAQEILAAIPGQPDAMRLLARAQWAVGDADAAVATLRQRTKADPRDAAAWRLLADLLQALGDSAGADSAHLSAVEAGVNDPLLAQAALALRADRLAPAEAALRERLKAEPTDVAAIRMLAEVAARLGRYEDSGNLLARCLELSPGFHEARRAYAQVLMRHERPLEALAEAKQLMAIDARSANHVMLMASIQARLGDHATAIGLYEDLLARYPRQPKGWMSYGHVLKTVGRRADAVAAYRQALEQAPQLGEVWWSLANLKTHRFTPADIALMQGQLARDDLGEEDRLHLDFALAKALEDDGDFAAAFAEYAKGNAIRHAQLRYPADEISDQVARTRRLFTPDFLAARRGLGAPAPDPIFIVGLPRAGSTLVEQILASHSAVEGTMELPDMLAIVRRLDRTAESSKRGAYPESVADLGPLELASLGEDYLEHTRIHRHTERPLFIDKLPNNWLHVGLIQLILPNATIIDARRHPLGCCLSGFKQHFALGQAFSYDLVSIGRYYRDYVELMAHFDAVSPGKVHRVNYERMVADTEGEVRALLDHVGLPFEDGCLRFWTNDRAVRTASSEQVRQPIFDDAVDHWRNFEPWLDPLKSALGPVLDAYPDAPEEF
ncbi:MAG TPA: sulfotransferase [Caulobacteraceae bacterium]|nr:sulfotransferase [Caulobacteraceae bacterium]